MITSDEFHHIAAEAYANPRAARYVVTPLSAQPLPYPFRTEDGAVPAMALQFAVEHLHDPDVRRVITLACTGDGYMLWCGDDFTQGDVSELEAGMRIGAALSALPAAAAEGAREAMVRTFGSYPHRAPCHFWKAWHSHHGVCKHVAAVLQHIELCFEGGLDTLLQRLAQDFLLMMRAHAAPTSGVSQPAEDRVQLHRFFLPTLPADAEAESCATGGGPNGYLIWLKNGRTRVAQWDDRAGLFVDPQGALAMHVVAAWAALPFAAPSRV